MSHKNIIYITFIFLIVLIFWVDISSATDCSKCHTTDAGRQAIKAKDTIEINDKTCLMCHNSDYPPIPIGYNTHLAHIGKYTAKVDYITRHPKATESLNCDSCHADIGENCKACHIKNIPHIKPPLGDNCKLCHGKLDKLFQHPTIDLKIHNLFNLDSDNTKACTICHNPDDMRSLKLANGKSLSIQESHKLCYQCHSGYYNLWDSSSHYANKSPPVMSVNYRMVPEVREKWENDWRNKNTCVNCHNPHNPSELYQLPSDERVDDATNIAFNPYLYLIGIIILIGCIIFIIKVKKLKLSDIKKVKLSDIKKVKLSDIKKVKLSDIKIPKIKIPKFSIPISISVESEHDRVEKVETEKVETEKVETEKIEAEKVETEKVEVDKPIPGTKKKTFLHRKDILFILSIGIMFILFYIIFGAFTPFVVVVSESMSPHIEKGDLIFYTDIGRIYNIATYKNSTYKNFGNNGDVILYRPFGKENVVPYIHRAIYYVEKGDKMWLDGPTAEYAGYITKGDNVYTNPKYDQQIDISLNQPVKKEWIVGVARFRIPYIGYIRMILP